MNYSKDNFDSDLSRERDNIYSTLTYRLPNNHSLALKNRWFKYKDTKDEEHSFFLYYIIPLKIPVSKKRDIGILKGKVYDGEKEERQPIPKVILTINEATAVTDQNGEFIFPALKQGTHYLQVIKSSIGLDRVTSEKLPLMVEIKGKTNEIEIGVVSSGRILGKIALVSLNQSSNFNSSRDKYGNINNNINNNNNNNPDQGLFLIGSGEIKNNNGLDNGLDNGMLKEPRGLSNILVELTNSKEVLRQLTDQLGRFAFLHTRPGQWTLRVYDNNLPPYHYLEKKEFRIELKPGGEKEITARVLPRRRSIQIIEVGEINKQKGDDAQKHTKRYTIQIAAYRIA